MKKFFSLIVLFFVITTYGAVTVNVNGSNYSIPQTNERGWGTAVTSWIQAISSNTLQPVGGSFTLTNDVDFGANFGLKAPYYLSRNLNPATSGLFRLSLTDYIGWRNNANNGNLLLGVNASDQLTFNGSALLSSGSIVNADINPGAAIDASKIANGQVSNAEFQSLDGVSAPIVTTTGAQAVTNKDIDGGTASNANRITVPKNTLTNLQALTRKQGTLVYDTTSNKPYYDDGSNLKVIGSGSGGAGNLIEDGDAEAGITNFVEGSYSAATRPSGTFTPSSGSGTFAISTSTSNPIFGNTSFLLTKSSGASRQGRSIERTISIDAGYRTKMLKTRIDYTIVSGTFVAGSNGSSPTDSSLIWYVGQYNGSTWSYTEPSTFKMFSNSTTNSDWVEGEFQVNSDTTQIKLIGFISESANSAWVVKAEVGFRLSTFLAGTTISGSKDWTPTGGWTGAVSYAGKWWQVGDKAEYHVTVTTSGAPTGTVLTINLPPGHTIDTSKLNTTTSDVIHVGTSKVLDSGVQEYGIGYVKYTSPTSVTVMASNASTTYLASASMTPTVPITFGASDTVDVIFSVPIQGWASSTQQSDGYDGRIIAMRATTSSQALGTATVDTVIFTAKDYDTTNSYNTSTGLWTCPRSGWYKIEGGAISASRSSAVWDFTNYIYVDAVNKREVAHYSAFASGIHLLTPTVNDTLYITAGQTVSIRARAGYAGISLDGSAARNVFTITGVNAPTTTSALARTSGTVLTTAGQSISANTMTKMAFATIDDDTHGSWSTANNEVSVNVAGRWEFCGTVKTAITSVTAGSIFHLNLYIDGGTSVKQVYFHRYEDAESLEQFGNFCFEVGLVSGQKVDLRVQSTIATTIDTTAGINQFRWKLIK